jgi:TRAP-type uncharacterized transport system substrate-binding protein
MKSQRRGSVMLVLGLAAVALAGAVWLSRTPTPIRRITLTAGPLDTTRAVLARAMADAIAAKGVEAELVATADTEDELARVDAGTVDFALVSEAYRAGSRSHVREVAPLYVEMLHLLVKEELADAVGRNLGALSGHTVDLGPRGSTSAGLATAVLRFAEVPRAGGPTGEGAIELTLDIAQLQALVAAGDRKALPDAVMHLATVPSLIATLLIDRARYRLVPLPFAEALSLNALITDDIHAGVSGDVDRQQVSDTVIPAYTYGIEPAIPVAALHSLGARLALVAHEATSPEVVELVLDAVFESRVARITHPPLERSVLQLPFYLPQHSGTTQYLRSDQPYITQDTVDALSNSISVIGALAGAALFFWQWWRQRKLAARDEIFARYLLRVGDVERRMAALELSATLELEPLAALQREVLELKTEALDRFAAGELDSQAVLTDLLTPLNAARDHIGNLLLHVRENIEEKAETEGRSAGALWTDAIDEPKGSGGNG